MNEVGYYWQGGPDGGYHIQLNGEQVFFTRDEYQKSMFIAELKAKIHAIESNIAKGEA